MEYENFLEAKNEAFEWNDTTGQETSFLVFAIVSTRLGKRD